MGSARNIGRLIGVLLLLQAAAGYVVNFVLLKPVLAAPPGFLVNAAAHPLQVGAAVLIGLTAAALSVVIAIAAWPVFRQHSQALALWLLALAIAGLSIHAVEEIAVLSMLSLSQAYVKAGAVDAGMFEALGALVRSIRNWAHYTNLLVAGGIVIALYSALYRCALVPRALASFGLAAALVQFAAITMPFFGHRFVFLLLMPIAVAHLAISLWLIVRGFDDRSRRGPAVLLQTQMDTRT